MDPSTSQNPDFSDSIARFLPAPKTLSEEVSMPNRAAGYGTITRVSVCKGGKPTPMWRLEMAAHKKSGRKRLRRYFFFKPDAEAARDAEILLRSDRTAWLSSLPTPAIRGLEEMLEKLAALPTEVQRAFNWSGLPALVDNHAWVHEPYLIQQVFQDYVEEQKALKKCPEKQVQGPPRAKKKETYLATVATMMARLFEDPRFSPTRNAKTVCKAEVVDWCNRLRQRLHPDTVDTYIRIARAVWNRAIDLDLLRVNPFAFAKRAPRGQAYVNLIDIHGPEEMERMLTVAWDYDPGMLGYIALGYVFALRGCEIIQLERSDIHREYGYIRVTKGKGSGNGVAFVRSVRPLDEAQWRWLDPILNSDLPICPRDYAKRLTRLRELAGLPAWERFIFRRTAMSYWYANGVTEEQLKRFVGHRERSGVSFDHYLAEISPTVAPKYVQVRPPAREPGTKTLPPVQSKSSKRFNSQAPPAETLDLRTLDPVVEEAAATLA